MNRKLIVWGSSGHAAVVADIIRLQARYDIVGFLDDGNPERREVDGINIVGGREQLDRLWLDGVKNLIFGFGDCRARLRLAASARVKGFQFATAIHPRAVVADQTSIGSGVVIAAAAVVCPGAQLGENVIINTGATVDHGCRIGEAVHIGPGVHLGGFVTIGEGAWVCIGATVCDRIRIGANSIVGAGSVITKDVPDGVVVYGVPGRVIRPIEAHP
ncbi:MAG: acetyltransferase [Verrucomicrobiota bacterium]